MAGPALTRVLQRLNGVKPHAGYYMARCPAHDDTVQSLQVSEHGDLSVGLHCHAGCAKSALLAAMGLSFPDLFSESTGKQVVATYDYRDLDGKLLYQSVRFYPKEFRQRRPNGSGGWIDNVETFKGKHVPYRLPDLKGHNTILVVEGEKDADRLWELGLPATTNIGGAEKWTPSDAKWLTKAGVTKAIIIPDNDEPGKKHALKVAKLLTLVGVTCTIQELPHLDPHGDVSDWLMNGGSKQELQAYIETPVEPTAPVVVPITIQVPSPEPEANEGVDPHEYHKQKDVGAAKWWRDRHQHLVRYDHQRKDWLVWQDHHWRPDANEEATRLAMHHIELLQQDALQEPEWTRRQAILDFAAGRMRKGGLTAMMDMAKAMLPIAMVGDTWDQNGWVLGCPNGVVDLKTGQLRDGTRDDLITLQAGTPYDSTATCPRWQQFLMEVFKGDETLVAYVHKALGYSLTADMREQCFFVGHGAGANGKSIFLDTLEKVFGTYAQRADMRMFAGFTSDINSFHIGDFRGKRMVLASEVRKGGRMNEHVIKHFTGGETVRGEYKFGATFTMRPVGKVWLGVNHRPKVADESFGFWRRVRLIPFLRIFDGTTDDQALRDELLAEKAGILKWAVDGCLLWQQAKLKAPEAVVLASDDYRSEEDPVAEFIEARLKKTDSDELHLYAPIHEAYCGWARQQGLPEKERLSSKALSSSLQAHGFEKGKSGGTVYFKGVMVDPYKTAQKKPEPTLLPPEDEDVI